MNSPNILELKNKIEKHYENLSISDLKNLFNTLQTELKDWDLAELIVQIREAQELFKEGEPDFDQMVIQDLER
jgi:hypothetical protein